MSLWLLLVVAAAPLRVYHCVVDQVSTYSDRPCPDAVTLTIDAATPVPFAPLDADDERALKALDTRLANAATARAKKRARHRQRQKRDRAASEAACNSAMDALARLSAQRRKGYRLSEAGKLAAAESQHLEAVRKHCR